MCAAPQSPNTHPLRVLRLARGLSLRGLARASGVSYRKISLLEHGLYPTPEELVRLSEALKCDAAELIATSEDRRRG